MWHVESNEACSYTWSGGMDCDWCLAVLGVLHVCLFLCGSLPNGLSLVLVLKSHGP